MWMSTVAAALRSPASSAAWRQSPLARWSSTLKRSKGKSGKTELQRKMEKMTVKAGDFILHSLVQAYPRAISYRLMMHALVDGGFQAIHTDARALIWRAYKDQKIINMPNDLFDRNEEGWEIFCATTSRQKSMTAFALEMTDLGYERYRTRTSRIVFPDKAMQVLQTSILVRSDLPVASHVLAPIREALGKDLMAKYESCSADQIPEEYLSVVKQNHHAKTSSASTATNGTS
ncbi:hypothetical protein FVE85_1830 [Porphyridium purpureum]|uniref:Uncharacterized protein n=1 Tax=Porphyridium purpureum TaxID=35688 RepID=A0A5J4YWW9_PORPP|nr:hypothetical protein FVE85_1830 [Porphyridium purpureum]|eukprot:POR6571..scf209_3